MTSFLSSLQTKRKKTPEQLASSLSNWLHVLHEKSQSERSRSLSQSVASSSSSANDNAETASTSAALADERNQLLSDTSKILAEMKLILVGDGTSTPVSAPEHTTGAADGATTDISAINSGNPQSPAGQDLTASSSDTTNGVSDEEKGPVRELSLCLQGETLLPRLIRDLHLIPFEARKDLSIIYTTLLRRNIAGFYTNHLLGNPHNLAVVVNNLVYGYSNSEIALTSGLMLRESIRCKEILRYILFPPNNHQHHQHESSQGDGEAQVTSDVSEMRLDGQPSSAATATEGSSSAPPAAEPQLLWIFFEQYLQLPNFDIASDSFNTLKEILIPPTNSASNKMIVREFLEQHADKFLLQYEILLKSENYVTRRRSLKMLGELLLDRTHYHLMMKYISSKDNLKVSLNCKLLPIVFHLISFHSILFIVQTIMNLLRHKSPNIQFE
jgi:hypothetical protein